MGKTALLILPFLIFALSTAKANQVTNGDFNNTYFFNASYCTFSIGFFGSSCTFIQNKSNFPDVRPTSWILGDELVFKNATFDVGRVTGQDPLTCGHLCRSTDTSHDFHMFLYTISKNNSYIARSTFVAGDPNFHVCGYLQTSPFTCSGTSTGGNITINPILSQNVTIPNQNFTLEFDYWLPFTYKLVDCFGTSPSGKCRQPTGEFAINPDGNYYNCYSNVNFDSNTPFTNCTTLTGHFTVELDNASDLSPLFIKTLEAADRRQHFAFNLTDINNSQQPPGFANFSAGNYVLVFFVNGNGISDNANGVDLDNIGINQIGAPNITVSSAFATIGITGIPFGFLFSPMFIGIVIMSIVALSPYIIVPDANVNPAVPVVIVLLMSGAFISIGIFPIEIGLALFIVTGIAGVIIFSKAASG